MNAKELHMMGEDVRKALFLTARIRYAKWKHLLHLHGTFYPFLLGQKLNQGTQIIRNIICNFCKHQKCKYVGTLDQILLKGHQNRTCGQNSVSNWDVITKGS